MTKKRVFLISTVSFAVILMIGLAVVFSNKARTSNQYAYQACRKVMLKNDGYGVWKLQNSHDWLFRARFEFDDSSNTATCTAQGFGSTWVGTKTMETLVACMSSLDDRGGNECPRQKFGVSP